MVPEPSQRIPMAQTPPPVRPSSAPPPTQQQPGPSYSLPENLEVKLDRFLRVSEVRDCEPKATPDLWDVEGGQGGCYIGIFALPHLQPSFPFPQLCSGPAGHCPLGSFLRSQTYTGSCLHGVAQVTHQ